MIYVLLCVAALCGIIPLAYGDHVVQDVRYAYDTDRLNVWFDTTDYEFKDLTLNVDCDGTAHAIKAGATFAEAVGFGNCAAGNFWFDWKDADGATNEPCISDCASKHPSTDTYSTKPISFSTPNTFALDMKKGYLGWSNNTGAPPYAMYRNGTLIVTLKTDLDNSTHYVAYDTDDKPTGGEVKVNGTGYMQWKDPDMTYHHWYHIEASGQSTPLWYDGCAPKECTLTLITNRGNVFNAVEVPSWKEAITFSAGTTVIINNTETVTEIVNTPRDPPLLFVAKNGDVHGVQSTSFYSGVPVSPNTRMVVDDLSYKTPLVLPQNPSGVLVVSGGSLVPAPAPKTMPTPSCPLEPTKTEHVGKASNFDIEDSYAGVKGECGEYTVPMYDHDRVGLNFGHHRGGTTVHVYRACEDCRADVTIGYGDRNKPSEQLPEQGSRGFLVGESQTISFVENSYRTPKVVGGYGYAPYQRPSSTQVMIDGVSGFMGEATGESKRTWTKAATRLGNGEVRYNLLGVKSDGENFKCQGGYDKGFLRGNTPWGTGSSTRRNVFSGYEVGEPTSSWGSLQIGPRGLEYDYIEHSSRGGYTTSITCQFPISDLRGDSHRLCYDDPKTRIKSGVCADASATIQQWYTSGIQYRNTLSLNNYPAWHHLPRLVPDWPSYTNWFDGTYRNSPRMADPVNVDEHITSFGSAPTFFRYTSTEACNIDVSINNEANHVELRTDCPVCKASTGCLARAGINKVNPDFESNTSQRIKNLFINNAHRADDLWKYYLRTDGPAEIEFLVREITSETVTPYITTHQLYADGTLTNAVNPGYNKYNIPVGINGRDDLLVIIDDIKRESGDDEHIQVVVGGAESPFSDTVNSDVPEGSFTIQDSNVIIKTASGEYYYMEAGRPIDWARYAPAEIYVANDPQPRNGVTLDVSTGVITFDGSGRVGVDFGEGDAFIPDIRISLDPTAASGTIMNFGRNGDITGNVIIHYVSTAEGVVGKHTPRPSAASGYGEPPYWPISYFTRGKVDINGEMIKPVGQSLFRGDKPAGSEYTEPGQRCTVEVTATYARQLVEVNADSIEYGGFVKPSAHNQCTLNPASLNKHMYAELINVKQKTGS